MKPIFRIDPLRAIRGLLLLAMTCTGLAGFAQDRVALIIGVSEYAPQVRANSLGGVKYDMDSAQKIATAMGVSADKIIFLRDAQATKPAIMQRLEQLGQNTPEGGRALVYFSGHGTRYFDREAGGCVEGLLTYEGETITHNEFAVATRKLSQRADKVIALMDACHSGGVVEQVQRTRSVLGGDRLSAKFHLKSGLSEDQCSTPSNMKTRGLLGEMTRLGALQENFVQITSSLPDEVSFDEAGKGGLATQGLRDCLLGQAQDTDRSGAVSLDEVRQCAQAFVDRRLQNAIGLLPHHITIRGNRNLIPVAVAANAPANPNVAAPAVPVASAVSESPVMAVPGAPAQTPPPASSSPTATTNVALTAVAPPAQPAPPAVPPAQPAPPAVPVATPTPPVTPQSASLSTLQDIFEQRDPRRKVDVKLGRQQLKIGSDALDLRITSSHAGYVYLVLLGSDAQSFYLLFPNGIDANHRIAAGQTLLLPRPQWKVQAGGPAGTDHVLVMVTQQPRPLSTLPKTETNAQNPFTYTLNDLAGRSDLIRFLVSSGASGKAESFGASMVSIEETP